MPIFRREDGLLASVPGNYAILDEDGLLAFDTVRSVVENYSNHFGAVDNFTEVTTTGNGTATEDNANHEMDLSCGVTIVGHALFQSKKTWVLNSDPIVVNFLIGNLVSGSGNYQRIHFGFKSDFADETRDDSVIFARLDNYYWQAVARKTNTDGSNNINAIQSGDLCTIIATDTFCKFYVNGILLHKIVVQIPTVALHIGASVVSFLSAPTIASEIGIDLISVKRYK